MGSRHLIAGDPRITLCFAFPDFFRIQIYIATYQPSDWGHIFVVPLIACWFVWLRRDELLAQATSTRVGAGIAIVVLGIIIYMVAMMGPKHLIHHLSRSLGVFVVSFGLVILFLGWQSLRVVGFPFVYLFVFGIVISDRIMTPITYELQDISAKGAWLVLYLTGVRHRSLRKHAHPLRERQGLSVERRGSLFRHAHAGRLPRAGHRDGLRRTLPALAA